jgi:hypothetical protein
MEKRARQVKHLCFNTDDMPNTSIAHFVWYLNSRNETEHLFPKLRSLELLTVAPPVTMADRVAVADANAALLCQLMPSSLCSLTVLDVDLEGILANTPEALGGLKSLRRLKIASGDCDKQGELITSSEFAPSLEEFTSLAPLDRHVTPLVDALCSSCSPSSLVHLSFNNGSNESSLWYPKEPTIAMTDIRKLFIFTRMTRLYIHAESEYILHTSFGDEELAEMASAWPHLEELRIPTNAKRSPLVTPKGLKQLVQACRHLSKDLTHGAKCLQHGFHESSQRFSSQRRPPRAVPGPHISTEECTGGVFVPKANQNKAGAIVDPRRLRADTVWVDARFAPVASEKSRQIRPDLTGMMSKVDSTHKKL